MVTYVCNIYANFTPRVSMYNVKDRQKFQCKIMSVVFPTNISQGHEVELLWPFTWLVLHP